MQVVQNVHTLMVYHTLSGLLPVLGTTSKEGAEGSRLLGYVCVCTCYVWGGEWASSVQIFNITEPALVSVAAGMSVLWGSVEHLTEPALVSVAAGMSVLWGGVDHWSFIRTLWY